tara:strand:- start:28573 stop:29403 length:831 start_codon:yes stop_codon:yes gene_type:complete
MRLENAITPEQVIMATMDQIRNTVSDFDLERMPTISASPLQGWPFKPEDYLSSAIRHLYSMVSSDKEFAAHVRMLMSLYGRWNGKDYPPPLRVELSGRNDEVIVRYEKCRISFPYNKPLMRPRLDWHDYFMDQALNASERSTCASGRRVGSVFVKDKVPLMSGFNGVPPNYPHPKVCPRIEAGCKSGEGLDMCPCNHAEKNAINLAAKHGVSLHGSTLYCTTRPCFGCMGDLAVAGVERVIYLQDYPNETSTLIAHHADIQVQHISEAKNGNRDSA